MRNATVLQQDTPMAACCQPIPRWRRDRALLDLPPTDWNARHQRGAPLLGSFSKVDVERVRFHDLPPADTEEFAEEGAEGISAVGEECTVVAVVSRHRWVCIWWKCRANGTRRPMKWLSRLPCVGFAKLLVLLIGLWYRCWTVVPGSHWSVSRWRSSSRRQCQGHILFACLKKMHCRRRLRSAGNRL